MMMEADAGDRARTVGLHLLRHADAGDPLAWKGPDELRPLSDRGHKQAERLARFLDSAKFAPDAVISSPRVRAVETAEPVAKRLHLGVRVDERLAGGLGLYEVEAILTDAGNPRRPVLVGHDPAFSELAAVLVGIAWFPVPKGACLRIDVELPLQAGTGVLRWLLPPDLLKPGH